MAKTLQTRIVLRYGTYSDWTNESFVDKGANLVLLPGEIGICEIPADKSNPNAVATTLFKVGGARYEDGSLKKFKDLPWASATAYDVNSWAKASDVVYDQTNKTITFVKGNPDGSDKTFTFNYVTEADVKATTAPIAAKLEAIEHKLIDTSDINAKLGDGFDATSTVKKAIEAAASLGQQGIEDAAAVQQSLTERLKALEETDNVSQTELDTYDAQVTSKLATKVDSISLSHAVAADPENDVEGIPERAEIIGTKLDIVIDAPTRAETIKLIADKVADVTGGESAADVKLSLEAEKARSLAKDTVHDAAIATLQGEASRVGSVAEAKALAQKGVDDAIKVADDLVIANIAIANNTRAVEAANDFISSVNTALTDRIVSLENKDSMFDSAIEAIRPVIFSEDGKSRIVALEARAGQLEGRDTELVALINAKANSNSVYTKTEVDGLLSDVVGSVDFSLYAKKADVDNTITAINAIIATKVSTNDVQSIVNNAVAGLQTEAQVDARINALIAAADPANGKVIANIQDLVKYVDENAGEITTLVTTTNNHTQKFEEIDASIVALSNRKEPKSSTEISVGADGTLGIVEISTDKLTQGSKTFILTGGSASVVTTV